jgi:acetyl esterase/lipase
LTSTSVLDLPPPPADLRISYGDDPFQFGDLRLPEGEGPFPVAVMIHGGFWRARYDLEHAGHLCAALTAVGVATWNVEYRRMGNKGGGWPGTFHDVGQALDFVRALAPQHGLDIERVVVLGHSAGGHLALWSAARHRIPAADPLYTAAPLRPCAAISLAGVVDLRRACELASSDNAAALLLGCTPDEAPGRYATASPIEMLPLGLPQVLLHGTEDPDVPVEMSEQYALQAQEAGDEVMLVLLPGASHFEVIDPHSTEWAIVEGAVLEALETVTGTF